MSNKKYLYLYLHLYLYLNSERTSHNDIASAFFRHYLGFRCHRVNGKRETVSAAVDKHVSSVGLWSVASGEPQSLAQFSVDRKLCH